MTVPSSTIKSRAIKLLARETGKQQSPGARWCRLIYFNLFAKRNNRAGIGVDRLAQLPGDRVLKLTNSN